MKLLSDFAAFCRNVWRSFARSDRPPALSPAPPVERKYKVKHIPRYTGPGEPPAGHWSPCHPSTVARFKAQMTCPNGHGLTLRGHSIESTGRAHPSVVCPVAGCTFHEFVTLDDWTSGDVPVAPLHSVGA